MGAVKSWRFGGGVFGGGVSTGESTARGTTGTPTASLQSETLYLRTEPQRTGGSKQTFSDFLQEIFPSSRERQWEW